MTCCGVEMYVWKCRQTKHVPDELTFLLSKHQFRLAVWNEPRHAPSLPSPERPVDRRHHLADCSLSLSLPLPLPPSDILTAGTGYQRQDTAIPSPLSALTSYSSSSRWPDGILGKYTAAFSAWNIVKKEPNLKGKSSHSFSPFCYPSLIIICSIFPRDLGKK